MSKDFYIWMFLDQDISPEEADKAFAMVKRENRKLLYRYADKTENKAVRRKVACMKMPGKEVYKEDAECLKVGLSISTATKLSTDQIQTAIDTLKEKAPKKAKALGILAADNPAKALHETDADTFFSVFNSCGADYRLKKLNKPLPKTLLEKVEDKEHFSQSVKLISTQPEYDRLQHSLLHVNPEKPKHKAAFFLAMNALTHNEPVLANRFLDRARERARSQIHIDKTVFWKFLVTHEEKYLRELADSPHINMYSLYAFEYFGEQPKSKVINNLITHNKLGRYPISDPFFWLEHEARTRTMTPALKNEYLDKFSYADVEPHLSVVLTRAAKFKEHYFIKPYTKFLKGKDKKRRALIFSIARQESLFIPSAISTSYALGMMQIMPFNVEAIAKAKKEEIPLTDMFKPKKNIEYADHLIESLVKRFKHPLFVAYAYNGGGGFTSRMMKRGNFSRSGEYEPFLSMELIDVDESRFYGKKVLANYYIYSNDLGQAVTMKELFTTAVNPL